MNKMVYDSRKKGWSFMEAVQIKMRKKTGDFLV